MTAIAVCNYCGYTLKLKFMPRHSMCAKCGDKNVEIIEYKKIDQYEGSPPFEEKEPETEEEDDYVSNYNAYSGDY